MERVFIALPLPISVSGDFCPWNKHRIGSKEKCSFLMDLDGFLLENLLSSSWQLLNGFWKSG